MFVFHLSRRTIMIWYWKIMNYCDLWLWVLVAFFFLFQSFFLLPGFNWQKIEAWKAWQYCFGYLAKWPLRSLNVVLGNLSAYSSFSRFFLLFGFIYKFAFLKRLWIFLQTWDFLQICKKMLTDFIIYLIVGSYSEPYLWEM